MAIQYNVDGTEVEIQPRNGRDFSLEELKAVVNGWIEIVWYGANLPTTHVLVVNEEGWILHPPLPYNPAASFIAGQPIAGNVLYCKRSEVT
jgi:hypothetical protein